MRTGLFTIVLCLISFISKTQEVVQFQRGVKDYYFSLDQENAIFEMEEVDLNDLKDVKFHVRNPFEWWIRVNGVKHKADNLNWETAGNQNIMQNQMVTLNIGTYRARPVPFTDTLILDYSKKIPITSSRYR